MGKLKSFERKFEDTGQKEISTIVLKKDNI